MPSPSTSPFASIDPLISQAAKEFSNDVKLWKDIYDAATAAAL